MLSSRYAPVVAVTVLLILLVVALGWFLAISPKLDESSDIRGQASDVEANTEQVLEASAALDTFDVMLAESPELQGVLQHNAPNSYDTATVRQRFESAIADSGVEVVGVELVNSVEVEGISADPSSLVSNQVAALFALGPINLDDETTPEGGNTAYVPVVSQVTGASAVVTEMFAVPVTLQVAGTTAESLDFLAQLADPLDPIFQIHTVNYEALQEDSAPILGVSSSNDGDVMTIANGYFYLLNPEPLIVDPDEVPGDIELPGESPFLEPGNAEPQSGAN